VTFLALSDPLADEASIGALIRDARLARGWSQRAWAAQYVKLRAAAGETINAFSAQTQLSNWERGIRTPDDDSQAWIAQTFESSPEALFGLQIGGRLPGPLILGPDVNAHTIELLKRRQVVHMETEHSFGPRQAAELVSADMRIIESVVRNAPGPLSAEIHAVAAWVAELGGSIAQECGDIKQARTLTVLARDYAEGSQDAALQAMILMRSANVVCPADPRTARLLLGRAADLVGSRPPSRLHPAIARQQAHAAALLADRPAFERLSAAALDYSRGVGADDDLAPYAHPGYVISETAAGLIVFNEAGSAADLLADQGLEPLPGQERDHGVAMARWLQALVACGDYASAAEHWHDVAMAYLRAPSARSNTALRAVISLRDANTQLRALQNELRPVVVEGIPPS
jgi:transcriptional regulator with XRE-family HTH domain